MNLEFRRQVFHTVFGLVLVSLIYFNYLNLMYLLYLLLIGLIISLVYMKREIKIIKWFLERFDRKEGIPGRGAITFLIGVILSLLLFEKGVALASIMILSLGDSICHLGRFGKIKHPFNENKYIEGVLAGIIAGGLGAAIFVGFSIAFFGSLIAMVFESFEIEILEKKLDDNIMIPIIAGIVMSI